MELDAGDRLPDLDDGISRPVGYVCRLYRLGGRVLRRGGGVVVDAQVGLQAEPDELGNRRTGLRLLLVRQADDKDRRTCQRAQIEGLAVGEVRRLDPPTQFVSQQLQGLQLHLGKYGLLASFHAVQVAVVQRDKRWDRGQQRRVAQLEKLDLLLEGEPRQHGCRRRRRSGGAGRFRGRCRVVGPGRWRRRIGGHGGGRRLGRQRVVSPLAQVGEERVDVSDHGECGVAVVGVHGGNVGPGVVARRLGLFLVLDRLRRPVGDEGLRGRLADGQFRGDLGCGVPTRHQDDGNHDHGRGKDQRVDNGDFRHVSRCLRSGCTPRRSRPRSDAAPHRLR